MSEGERKKLGPLALRLVERLQGPALQIAKGIGLETLAKEDGVAKLLVALEADRFPCGDQWLWRCTQPDLHMGCCHGKLARIWHMCYAVRPGGRSCRSWTLR